MLKFTLHLPSRVVTGACESDDATDRDILTAFLADFAEGPRSPGVVYQIDSFVRLSYSFEYHEPSAPAKIGPASKTKKPKPA